MAKSFFQIYEQAARHRAGKILREAEGQVATTTTPPAAGQNNTQTQTNAPVQKQTSQPELTDDQLMNSLNTNWTKFANDNQAAIKKLAELAAGKTLAQTFNNMPGEMKKILAAVQQQAKKPAATATSATTGTAAAATNTGANTGTGATATGATN